MVNIEKLGRQAIARSLFMHSNIKKIKINIYVLNMNKDYQAYSL